MFQTSLAAYNMLPLYTQSPQYCLHFCTEYFQSVTVLWGGWAMQLCGIFVNTFVWCALFRFCVPCFISPVLFSVAPTVSYPEDCFVPWALFRTRNMPRSVSRQKMVRSIPRGEPWYHRYWANVSKVFFIHVRLFCGWNCEHCPEELYHAKLSTNTNMMEPFWTKTKTPKIWVTIWRLLPLGNIMTST